MTVVRRKLSQGDLDLFLVAHARFVEGKAGGRRLSLKFLDLTGLDLSGRLLDDADFTGACLENAILRGARMERAILFGCDRAAPTCQKRFWSAPTSAASACRAPVWKTPT